MSMPSFSETAEAVVCIVCRATTIQKYLRRAATARRRKSYEFDERTFEASK